MCPGFFVFTQTLCYSQSFENVVGTKVRFSITYEGYTEDNLYIYLSPNFDNATAIGTYTVEDPYLKAFAQTTAYTLYDNGFAQGEDGSSYLKYIKEDNVLKFYPDNTDDKTYLLFNIDEENQLITTYTFDEDKLVSNYNNASEYNEKDYYTSYRELYLYNDGKVGLTINSNAKESYLFVFETSYVEGMTTIELMDTSIIICLDNENKTFVVKDK